MSRRPAGRLCRTRIAGPGDPLANPEKTFKTFELIARTAPDIKLCLSTNGLALPDHVDTIAGFNVDHVTITINMVDRVLFDSGRADIKPAGLKVLKQVSDVLNKITDKQIRIEGHTDNVPISAKLQDRFKTNWELSTTRATTVVRYLIDHGGVQPQSLSAVGYADTHPIASNDSEEGRSSNRRIEIVLYPKDLSQIAAQ